MSNTQPRAASPQKYKRVLLKISGEALMGNREYGMDPARVAQIARDVAEVRTLGIGVCLVVGGGNIFRGVSAAARGMARASADYMGMLEMRRASCREEVCRYEESSEGGVEL